MSFLIKQSKVGIRLVNYGDRSFTVSGPAVWNSLPAALRQTCHCLYFVGG